MSKKKSLKELGESFLFWVGSSTDLARSRYKKPVENFIDFLDNPTISTDEESITLDDTSRFLVFLNTVKRYKPRYVNYHVTVLKLFLKYLKALKYDVVDRDLVRYRRIEAEDRPILQEEQLVDLLNAFQKSTNLGFNQYVVIRFIYETGIRVSELSTIKLQELDFKNQMVKIRRRKSKKFDVVSWSDDLNDQLYEYFMWRVRQRASTDNFFINRNGKVIAPRSVQRWVKMAREIAGIEIKATPHVLRHQGAHELLDRGGTVKDVGAYLGHSPDNLKGTAIYIRQTLHEKIKMARKAKMMRFGVRTKPDID